jgi:hypothetical protein
MEKNMADHSPAPWVINDEDPDNLKVECAAYEDETPGICGSHSKEWLLTIDDARLIAAAPDLLSALQDAAPYVMRQADIESGLDHDPDERCAATAIKRMRAAIKKAGG